MSQDFLSLFHETVFSCSLEAQIEFILIKKGVENILALSLLPLSESLALQYSSFFDAQKACLTIEVYKPERCRLKIGAKRTIWRQRSDF